jgi:hypothetical protein
MLSIIPVLVSCSSNQTTSGSKPDEPVDITVELREGFTGEPVKVFSANRQVYTESPRTRDVGWSYMADRFNFKMSSKKASLRFVLPDRNFEQTLDIDISKGTMLAVSVKDNKFQYYQPNFFVDLQGGFHENDIQVLIDGREIFNKKIVNDAILGISGSADTELTADKIKLTIKVADLKIQKDWDIDVKEGAYIGIQLNIKELTITQQKSQFFYM